MLKKTISIIISPKLFKAINSNDLERVKYLVEKGANIESKDNFGCTPLHRASWGGNLDIVKYLVEKGANIESKDNDGCTPLNSVSKS